MKEMRKKVFIIALAALLVVGTISIAFSQGFGRRSRGFGPGSGFGGPGMMAGFTAGPNLTKEQLEKLQALRTDFQKETVDIRNKMQLTRLELQQLWLADELNEDAILAKTKECSALRTQLQEKAVQHRIKIRKIFTKEQWDSIKRFRNIGKGPIGMMEFGQGPHHGPMMGFSRGQYRGSMMEFGRGFSMGRGPWKLAEWNKAQKQTPMGGTGRFGAAHFSGLDSDSDGKITKEELLAMHAKADTDSDGAITHEDLQKHIENAIGNGTDRGETSRGCGGAGQFAPGGGRPSATAIFDRIDKNSDGKLTKDEVPDQMRERLAAADSDGNGSVSKKEFEKVLGSGRGGPPSGARGEGGLPLGAGGGPPFGAGTNAGSPSGGPRGAPFGPDGLLRMFDKNNDNKLAKEEVPEELWERHFSKADGDGDGALTKKELEETFAASGKPASVKDEN